jgi:hypothetical protein
LSPPNDHPNWREAEINVTGLAGFLLAKMAAAHGRHKPKDWYDIAFVLPHNDYGDGDPAAATACTGDQLEAALTAVQTEIAYKTPAADRLHRILRNAFDKHEWPRPSQLPAVAPFPCPGSLSRCLGCREDFDELVSWSDIKDRRVAGIVNVDSHLSPLVVEVLNGRDQTERTRATPGEWQCNVVANIEC